PSADPIRLEPAVPAATGTAGSAGGWPRTRVAALGPGADRDRSPRAGGPDPGRPVPHMVLGHLNLVRGASSGPPRARPGGCPVVSAAVGGVRRAGRGPQVLDRRQTKAAG